MLDYRFMQHLSDPDDLLRQFARQLEQPPAARDEDVLAHYESAIKRFCRSRTRSKEDAEDAAQDAFVRYLRRSDRAVRNPEAWLITAASRSCIEINRRRRYEEQFMAAPPGLTADGRERTRELVDARQRSPEQLTVEAVWITQLLRRLNERDRVVITQLYLMGSSLSQVAAFLGVSYDNLKMIAVRARRHARKIVESATPTPR